LVAAGWGAIREVAEAVNQSKGVSDDQQANLVTKIVVVAALPAQPAKNERKGCFDTLELD